MNDYAQLFNQAEKITVLTGAGVSTDSGIADFKTADSAWVHDEPRTSLMALPYFLQQPKDFWAIYREVFGTKIAAEPNSVHRWLASLEVSHEVTIITQNVDGLHQVAGSTKVIESHGSAHRVICIQCYATASMDSVVDQETPWCLICDRALKPDVSLFMEGVNGLGEARDAILESELFMALGTSLRVGPVNELPYVAMYATTQPTLYVNREAVSEDYDFTYTFEGGLLDFAAEVSN